MTHKELTSHIRQRLAKAGVKARCKMDVSCGSKYIAIDTPAYDAIFTAEQQTAIFNIVTANHLTLVRGLPVRNDGTMTHGGHFHIAA